MKATGIVRRIDELGRVVIPKEIRRTLRIREGDPLELFTDRDELMLKKYSPIASVERFSEGTARSLHEQSGYLAAITDADNILHAFGTGRKGLAGRAVSDALVVAMTARGVHLASAAEGGKMLPVVKDGEEAFTAQLVVPIVSGGDCLGCVLLLSSAEGAVIEPAAVKLARLTADIIASQFE